jgi:hypothetical protein
MDIDWQLIKKSNSVLERSNIVRDAIAACKPGDNIFLSECIVRAAQEGVYVLMELAQLEERALRTRQPPMTWKLLCLKDEWGDVPQPGDKIVKIEPINTHTADGKLVKPMERNIALNNGTYSDDFENRIEYTVDEKGCIECSKTDAVYFLNRYGIHPKSRRPIGTGGRKEFSTEPVLRADGQKMHLHFRRFMEMTNEAYEKLPPREPSKEPKRGTKSDGKQGAKQGEINV